MEETTVNMLDQVAQPVTGMVKAVSRSDIWNVEQTTLIDQSSDSEMT